MRYKSPQNSTPERTTTIANLVKHRNLQRFGTELWVNAVPDWLKIAWADWDSALNEMGQRRTRLEMAVRLLK
jgi:hypothetical protein